MMPMAAIMSFIDVGANIGVHARFLLEPEKYPDAPEVKAIFDHEFGTNRNNKNICAFEIEPNPVHKQVNERNAAAYKAMGWRYHYMPYAASHRQNSTLDFYHQDADMQSNVSEWGFSSSPERASSHVEKVPSLRLSKWLNDHVHGRIVPDVVLPHGGGDDDDDEQAQHMIGAPRVVMKMDIEGAEYSVLPDLMTSGALCKSVDFLFGEFHYFHHSHPPLHQGIHNVLEASYKCKTRIVDLDSEAYLLDGMPLPSPYEQ
jgi:Methyltransferase FkbM domain